MARLWLLSFYLCFSIAAGTRVDDGPAYANCPDGWTLFRGHCYHVSVLTDRNWKQAREFCRSMDSDLLILKSSAEKDFVHQLLKVKGDDSVSVYWIGLRYSSEAGGFTWVDDSSFSTELLAWQKSEPSHCKDCCKDGSSDDCVWMKSSEGLISNECCQEEATTGLLCKKQAVSDQESCLEGWSKYGDSSCMRQIIDHGYLTWRQADDNCKSHGGNLASVTTEQKQAFVTDLIGNEGSWIGLSNLKNVDEYVWSDGETLDYTALQDGVTLPTDKSRCVSMQHFGDWLLRDCNELSHYHLCERPVGKCHSGWREFNGRCYGYRDVATSWGDARDQCETLGTKLLVIDDDKEQAFVVNTYYSAFSDEGLLHLWLGISDTDKDGVFKTVSGDSVRYEKWAVKPLKDKKGLPDCGLLYTAQLEGLWFLGGCYARHTYICESKIGDPIHPPPDPSFRCPSSSLHFVPNGSSVGSCYFFSEISEIGFEGARNQCKRRNGDLVSINTVEELSFVAGHMKTRSLIGLNDMETEGVFVWPDGSSLNPVLNSTWDDGEPNNHGGNEDCVEMLTDGTWNDCYCTTMVSYICEGEENADVSSSTAIPPDHWLDKCSIGYESFEGSNHCYKWSEDILSWYDANSFCKSEGGDLLSIFNLEEAQYVSDRAAQDAARATDMWIGANDQDESVGWRWSDGTPFRYTFWQSGEPNGGTHENCVHLSGRLNGRWSDNDCGRKIKYVCKRQASTLTLTTLPPPPTPSSGETVLNCTQLFSEVGFVSPVNVVRCPAGCGVNADSVFGTGIYADLSSVCQAAVHNGRATNEEGGVFTVLKAAGQAYFTGTTSNSVTSHSFTHTTWSFTFSGKVLGCEMSWTKSGNQCFKFFPGKTDWFTAESGCIKEGGHLAAIDSQAQNFDVFELQTQQKEGFMSSWIGMNDLRHPMLFSWSDSSKPVLYTRWDAGEPNNFGGQNEDCVAMNKNLGYWMDVLCSERLSYTCSRSLSLVDYRPVEPIFNCPSGWTHSFNKHCYVQLDTVATFEDAQHICIQNGGSLIKPRAATIAKQKETYYFLSAAFGVNGAFQFWIDTSSTAGKHGVEHKWTDGARLVYTPWGVQQPRDIYVNDCVSYHTTTNMWQTSNCDLHLHFVCETATSDAIFPTVVPTPPPMGSCPAGWTALNNGYCYQFNAKSSYGDRLIYEEAQEMCRLQGSTMVSIHTDEDNWDLYMPMKHADSFWIGLDRLDVAAGYTWSNGRPLNYIAWETPQPDFSSGSSLCVQMSGASGRWSSSDCDARQNWICSVAKGSDIIVPTAEPTLFPKIECAGEEGSYFYDGNCYLFVEVRFGGWRTARDDCHSQGYELASIHSKEQLRFLRYHGGAQSIEKLWIGLHSTDFEGNHRWSDGSVVDYTNWAAQQPNTNGGERDCVFMDTVNGGLWGNDGCGVEYGYICEKYNGSDVVVPTIPPRTGNCPEGWRRYGEKCFQFFGIAMSWNDSRLACKNNHDIPENRGAESPYVTLASIGSIYEQALLTYLAGTVSPEDKSFWIGLNNVGTEQGPYRWVDQSEFSFANWAGNEPSSHNEECVEMYAGTSLIAGRWNDYRCDGLRSFICSTFIDPQYVVTTPYPSSCDAYGPGYKYYQNSCYKLGDSRLSWDQAEASCQEDDVQSHLMEIFNLFHNSYLLAQLGLSDKHSEHDVWIGLSDKGNIEQEWRWLSGAPAVDYTNWNTGAPDLDMQKQSCVSMTHTGKWNNTDCGISRPFMCQINMNPATTVGPDMYADCPEGWTAREGYCYVLEESPRTFYQARHDCQVQGAELTSVHSQNENTFLTQLKTTDTWIGLYHTDNEVWHWTDGTGVAFFHWLSSSSTDQSWSQCGVLYANSGMWDKAYCSHTKQFICKAARPLVPPTTTLPTTTISPTDPVVSTTTTREHSTSEAGKSTPGTAVVTTPDTISTPGTETQTGNSSNKAAIAVAVLLAVVILVILALIGAWYVRSKKFVGSVVVTKTPNDSVSFTNPGYEQPSTGETTLQIQEPQPVVGQ